ncbi:peptide arginase family protein [Methanothermococcus okinawensis]
MRILDIDLDFFLNKIMFWKKDNKRLNEKEYIPWKKEKVIDFLENRCGLSSDNKIKGRIIKKHHEAFYFWRELIYRGELTLPFEVVHIDAHADLGLGDLSYKYIMEELLHKPLNERDNPNPKYICEGNYLAFSIANSWISKLTYITHPKGGNDLLKEYFMDYNLNSGYIQMKKMNDVNNPNSIISLEPKVKFEKIPYKDFKDNGNFNYIVLAISPRYTPKRADALIPIFRKYIDEI